MSPKALPDAAARDRIQTDLGTNLVVEAAAGTGKTTALVGRIMEVVKHGGRLDRMVAVTFTDKAAGEMKMRLRSEIGRARSHATDPAHRAHIEAALSQLEGAHIGTIHSFCAELLRKRPVEARVDPLFHAMSQDRARAFFDEVFDGWFERTLADPPEGVRRLLRRRPARRDEHGPRELLRSAAFSLAEHRDFDAAWRRAPLERHAAIDSAVGGLAEIGSLAMLASWQDGFFAQALHELRRSVEGLERREHVRGRDYEGLEAELVSIRRLKIWRVQGGRSKSFGPGLLTRDVISRRDAIKAELDSLVQALQADLAACLREELRHVVREYEDRKARAGALDSLDLLLCTRDLLQKDRRVRNEKQDWFTHVFVDEFQDTDSLQVEILLLLTADEPAETEPSRCKPAAGKLFVVGDPKQSIYRFRRAEVALYEDCKRRLLETGASFVRLTASFRSVPSLQSAVNAAFAPVMHRAIGQAAYVSLESVRDEPAEQPSLVALPVPHPYGDYGRVVRWQIEKSLPDATAAFIEWLLGSSGWTVTEREGSGERVRVQARHVCILFKRLESMGEDVAGATVRALEARRIPHVLVGGRSLYEREEVVALRNALAAIEWPDDELSVYATLHGPFFALGDDALLAYRHAHGTLDPLRPIDKEGERDEVATALLVIAWLHRGRNRRPIADTLSHLLAETRAHAGLAIWPHGEQALANVLHVLDLARSFERSGATSFRAFVDTLFDTTKRAEASEAPVVEDGTDGVRIMTVHRAQGLEFPVVVLADPTAPRAPENPSRHVDPERRLWLEPLARCAPTELIEHREEALARDEEEAVRLAYVAATRARDLLVVPVVGDADGIEGWLDALWPSVYPRAEHRRQVAPAPRCPTFGNDSVLERPVNAEATVENSVAPGLHAAAVGDHKVVFWDPRALRLDLPHEAGLRQQKLFEADAKGGIADEGSRAYAAWLGRRLAIVERARTPSLFARAAMELGAKAVDSGAEQIEVAESGVISADRPSGKRFGTLVHAVLACAELDAEEQAVRAVASQKGRLLGASEDEVCHAAVAAWTALSHPYVRRAMVAQARGECLRGTAIYLRLDDGTIAEGVVDLAFREPTAGGTAWTVVGFKTALEIETRRAEYVSQLRLCRVAIARATGEPCAGVLLRV